MRLPRLSVLFWTDQVRNRRKLPYARGFKLRDRQRGYPAKCQIGGGPRPWRHCGNPRSLLSMNFALDPSLIEGIHPPRSRFASFRCPRFKCATHREPLVAYHRSDVPGSEGASFVVALTWEAPPRQVVGDPSAAREDMGLRGAANAKTPGAPTEQLPTRSSFLVEPVGASKVGRCLSPKASYMPLAARCPWPGRSSSVGRWASVPVLQKRSSLGLKARSRSNSPRLARSS